MVEESVLEKVYQERLEERIITHIAQLKNINLAGAMDFYYRSHLANKIATGQYNMQYLDYKLLAQFIVETEDAKSTAEVTK